MNIILIDQNKQPTLFYTHGEYPGHSQEFWKMS